MNNLPRFPQIMQFKEWLSMDGQNNLAPYKLLLPVSLFIALGLGLSAQVQAQ